ncbi:glycosyltransferase [Symbiobacterium thermophilum]|uniref:glycosyltransferase n=1 Tax=Symbiobacterium thermophilum TaxID=2734 RepID=UPI0035C6D1DD
MPEDPKVTVVIPAYNAARYLAEAVESALNQTYSNLEVLVVDDGSTDRTPFLLERYGRAIRTIRKRNGGTPSALNEGIRQARGEWIAWLSADDAFLPEKLAKQMAYAEAHPECALIYTNWFVVDGRGKTVSHLASPTFRSRADQVEKLLRGCVINGSTTLVRRDVYLRAGLFDESLPQAHDWDMWLRLARDYRFGHVAEPLLRYRWHGENLSARPDALAYNDRVLAKARAYLQGWLPGGGGGTK